MPTEQYHEPPEELPEDIRTFARMCTSLIEEAEAIGWYAQRLAVERDFAAAAIMRDAQNEEFKHFSMDLEYLLAAARAGEPSPSGSCSSRATSSSTERRARKPWTPETRTRPTSPSRPGRRPPPPVPRRTPPA